MAATHDPDRDDPHLRDPEFSAEPGVSRRTFLGVPAWAATVGAVIVALLLWAMLLLLG